MRRLAAAAVALTLGACTTTGTYTPTTATGADLATVREAGGTILKGPEVDALLASASRDAILNAAFAGSTPASWTVRPDGSLCGLPTDLRTCRLVVRSASGLSFFTHGGQQVAALAGGG